MTQVAVSPKTVQHIKDVAKKMGGNLSKQYPSGCWYLHSRYGHIYGDTPAELIFQLVEWHRIDIQRKVYGHEERSRSCMLCHRLKALQDVRESVSGLPNP
jgi:hypothetical protein